MSRLECSSVFSGFRAKEELDDLFETNEVDFEEKQHFVGVKKMCLQGTGSDTQKGFPMSSGGSC